MPMHVPYEDPYAMPPLPPDPTAGGGMMPMDAGGMPPDMGMGPPPPPMPEEAPLAPEDMLGSETPPGQPLTTQWVPFNDGKIGEVTQAVCAEIGGIAYKDKDGKKFCLACKPGEVCPEPPGSKPLVD